MESEKCELESEKCRNLPIHQCITHADLAPLVAMMDHRIQDNNFKILTFEKNLKVKGQDPIVYYHFKGVNKSDKTQDILKFLISGDAKLDLDKVKLAYGYHGFDDRLDLLPRNGYEYDVDKKAFFVDIHLDKPCASDEEFEIWFRYEWPGSLNRINDYLFYPCGFFSKGVSTLKSEFTFDTPLLYANLYRVLHDDDIQKPLELKIDHSDDYKTWNFELPDASGFYLAKFHRKENTDNNAI